MSSTFLRLERWTGIWLHLANFEESVVCGLIWYIQVSLLHSGYLPGHLTLECVKAHHLLTLFIYSEADWLFNTFHWIKSSLDFVVVECTVYPQLNGLPGQIHNFKKQNGQYIVAVNTLVYSSLSCLSSVLAQLCPQYMEPLHKVTKFGINISYHQRNGSCVSSQSVLWKWANNTADPD